MAPVVDDHWMRAEFPHDLVKGFADLDIAGRYQPHAPGPTARRLLTGFLALELAHVDPSINSFIGIHAGLAMGSIDAGGDEAQRARWLPAMARLEKIGAFGLTEPHGGSDVAGGLETTARRDGEEWVLDGAKRWIGNVTASLGIAVRMAQLQDDGIGTDAQAALAKEYCSSRMREVVAWGRELLGGNGILIEHHLGRFFNDAEAFYSYEGTRQINTLIVGRAITDHSSFV